MDEAELAMDCPEDMEEFLAGIEVEPFSEEELRRMTDKLVRNIRKLQTTDLAEVPKRKPVLSWRKNVVITAGAAAAVIVIYGGYCVLRTRKGVLEYAKVPPKNSVDTPPLTTITLEPATVAYSVKEIRSQVAPSVASRSRVARDFPDASDAQSEAGPSPRKTELPARKYITVAPGESLSTIAQRELGSSKEWSKIWECNRDAITDPNRIKPGQRLEIVQARSRH